MTAGPPSMQGKPPRLTMTTRNQGSMWRDGVGGGYGDRVMLFPRLGLAWRSISATSPVAPLPGTPHAPVAKEVDDAYAWFSAEHA